MGWMEPPIEPDTNLKQEYMDTWVQEVAADFVEKLEKHVKIVDDTTAEKVYEAIAYTMLECDDQVAKGIFGITDVECRCYLYTLGVSRLKKDVSEDFDDYLTMYDAY